LPTYVTFNARKVFDVLKHDKKRERSSLHYVLLSKIGKGVIKTIPLETVRQIIQELN